MLGFFSIGHWQRPTVIPTTLALLAGQALARLLIKKPPVSFDVGVFFYLGIGKDLRYLYGENAVLENLQASLYSYLSFRAVL